MADDLTLKISADATGVQKGVNQATSSLDTLNADASKTSKSLAKLGEQKVAPTVTVTVKDQAIAKAKADIARLRDEVAAGLSVGADTRPAQRRIAELQRSIRSLEDKPHTVKVNVETKQSTSRLSTLGDKLGNIRNLAGEASVVMGEFGAVAAVSKLSADMETLRARFATVVGTGQEAQKVFDDIKRFADSTPFEFPDLVEATTLLKGFGVETKDLLVDLNGLGEAAARSGASVKDVAEIYGQMLAKGKITAEDELQLRNRGIFVYEALAKQLGVTADQARRLAEEGKITKEQIRGIPAAFGTLYSGAIANQAETFNGKLSTTKDTLNSIGVAFGDVVNPALKEWLDLINSSSLPQGAQKIGVVLSKIREAQSLEILPRPESAEHSIKGIGSALGDVVPALEAVKEATKRTNAQSAAGVTVYKNLADAYAEAKSNLDGLLQSLDVFDAKGMSRQEAQIAYQRAIDDATEALKENGRTLDVNSEKGRQNREALTDVAKAIGDQTNARLRDSEKSGESTTKILADYNAMREALIKQAQRFTGSRKAAEDYVNTLLDTPDEVKTDVKVTGVEEAKRKLDELTKEREATIKLNLSISRRVQNELNRLGAGIVPYALPPVPPTSEPSPVPSGLQVAPPTAPAPASPSLRGVVPQGSVAGAPVMLPALTSSTPTVVINVSDKRLADFITVAVRDAVSGSLRVLNSRQVVQT